MKTNFLILCLASLTAMSVIGCSSESTGAATPEAKTAFAGSAPPSDYMKNIKTAPPASPPPGTK